MFSQAFLALGLLGAASVTANPIVSRESNCTLLGDSALGFNVTGIRAYPSY